MKNKELGSAWDSFELLLLAIEKIEAEVIIFSFAFDFMSEIHVFIKKLKINLTLLKV